MRGGADACMIALHALDDRRGTRMMFWLVVAAVIAIALGLAWRSDRRRKVGITRRNATVERDIAAGMSEGMGNRLRDGNGRSAG
jgi:hypothetical protein